MKTNKKGGLGGMGFIEWLNTKKQLLSKQLDHGRQVSEQLRAKRLRKQDKKLSDMKPGTKHTLLEGLKLHKSPWDVAREEYSRRKYERNKKYNK